MEFLLLLFFGFPILILIAILVAIGVIKTRNKAKSQAKRMIESGKIAKIEDFNRVSTILATMTNDLEAIALWQKLQEMKH